MNCITSTSSGEESLNYLVGPLKEINQNEKTFYDLAKECMSDEKNNREINSLFIKNPQLLPPLQQMTYRKWKAGVSLGQHWPRWRKKKAIYIQPIDDFPEFLRNFTFTVSGFKKSDFIELLKEFTEIFFSGFRVEILKATYLNQNGWEVKRRIHDQTNEGQMLASDLHRCLGKSLPRDGSCILGLSWTDLYPTEDLNFVLGEASPERKCAMFSFGRFQPKLYSEGAPPEPLSKVDGDLIWKMVKVRH